MVEMIGCFQMTGTSSLKGVSTEAVFNVHYKSRPLMGRKEFDYDIEITAIGDFLASCFTPESISEVRDGIYSGTDIYSEIYERTAEMGEEDDRKYDRETDRELVIGL
jgi:hypothetical protein